MTAFTTLQSLPTDPIFAILMAYNADPHPSKVSLGVGVYKTDEAQNYTLPSVRQAMKLLSEDPTFDHDYLPLAGYAPFIAHAREIIFGPDSPVPSSHVASIQTISGTGAVHTATRFLFEQLPPISTTSPGQETRRIWVSNPTWGNHHVIFEHGVTARASSPIEQEFYPYYEPNTCSLDFRGLVDTLEREGKKGDIILLHACAHNPTGIEPNRDQWQTIADICKRKGLFPFFDIAYQGFASGDLDRDAWAIRLFAAQGLEIAVAQSFSKNLGLYGQRVGALHIVCADDVTAKKAATQILEIQRSEISMPPSYGARIADMVFSTPALNKQWKEDLKEMSGRIVATRQALFDELTALGTPGSWKHIVDQVGMFSYTGLTVEQIRKLREQYHIYLLDSSRASISGINTKNVKYIAKAIDAVVRETTKDQL
ncbi:hypothetical protein KEM56_005550 [Ascosphaera pollenicola]|nr:hypothetical protein KEM56_005550 [Ascosphaera pollenicola]